MLKFIQFIREGGSNVNPRFVKLISATFFVCVAGVIVLAVTGQI